VFSYLTELVKKSYSSSGFVITSAPGACEVMVLAVRAAGWGTDSCQERYALFPLPSCGTGAAG